jgi:hypothetical protein
MINHQEGPCTSLMELTERVIPVDISTTISDLDKYNNDHASIACQSSVLTYYAMRDFIQGEELTMCYGDRTNEEYFIYQGFACAK